MCYVEMKIYDFDIKMYDSYMKNVRFKHENIDFVMKIYEFETKCTILIRQCMNLI